MMPFVRSILAADVRPHAGEPFDFDAPPFMTRHVFGLFDAWPVHVLTGDVSDAALGSISAAEAAAISDVSHKRRREFAAARALAREGLERYFDIRGFDLLNAEDRSPIWPSGVAGSISHSDNRAWVALSGASFGTIGIDGEERNELSEALWHLTLRTEETAYLEKLDPAVRGRRALIIFSAKESLYKAQYPWSGACMDYMAANVGLDESGSLTCTFLERVGPFPSGYVVNGRWRDDDESIVTAVWIAAQGSSRDGSPRLECRSVFGEIAR
jgi:4'-phosphopantetheinyl transferase EntD